MDKIIAGTVEAAPKFPSVFKDQKEFGKWMDSMGRMVSKQTVAGLVLQYDKMSGVIEAEFGDHMIYATPFWEGSKGIAFAIVEIDGDGTPVYEKDLPFEATGDLKSDARIYLNTVENEVRKVFRKYLM